MRSWTREYWKQSWWSERDLSSELPDFKSSFLTTSARPEITFFGFDYYSGKNTCFPTLWSKFDLALMLLCRLTLLFLYISVRFFCPRVLNFNIGFDTSWYPSPKAVQDLSSGAQIILLLVVRTYSIDVVMMPPFTKEFGLRPTGWITEGMVNFMCH